MLIGLNTKTGSTHLDALEEDTMGEHIKATHVSLFLKTVTKLSLRLPIEHLTLLCPMIKFEKLVQGTFESYLNSTYLELIIDLSCSYKATQEVQLIIMNLL